MNLVADILLAAGALAAGIYCLVLSRRLNRFNSLEKGVGGAVAVLSSQVDSLNDTLTAAQRAAEKSASQLTELTKRAEETSRKLELQIAALHDLPEEPRKDQVMPERQPASPPPAGAPLFTRHRHVEEHA